MLYNILHNILCIRGGVMDFKKLDPRYLMYGSLSVLDNRIAALQSEEFKDLTMKQHFLLVSIGTFDDNPTLSDVSDLIGCSYQNVKRMAEQLQDKGYLTIRKDEEDRRKLRLVPEEKLMDMTQDKQEVTQQFMDRMYRDISEDDLMTALSVILKMTENISRE